MRVNGREESPRAVSLNLAALIAVTAAAGSAVAAAAALQWAGEDLLLLAVLTGFAVFSVRFDISLFYQSRVSVTVVPILVAATLAGLPGVLVVGLAAELAAYLGRGKPYYKSVFNGGALLLAGAAYIAVLEGFSREAARGQWPDVFLPAMAGVLVNFFVNSALVGLAVSSSSGRSFVLVWKENYGWLTPHYALLGVMVAAMASAYRMDGVATMALVFVPVVILRFGIQLQKAHKELAHAHEQVRSGAQKLQRAYDGTLRSLLSALDNRDNNTGGHSERVAQMALAIADEMGIQRGTPDWDEIRCGALLHDVGKIAVPDAVLHKESALSDDEWELMRRHPQVGFEIINRVELLATAASIVLAHHERFDGTGYPHRLGGEKIPLGARIFAVADAFDAMTSDRPYRKAMSKDAALEELSRCSGTQFDPGVVSAFLRMIARSTESGGQVAASDLSFSALPGVGL